MNTHLLFLRGGHQLLVAEAVEGWVSFGAVAKAAAAAADGRAYEYKYR